jgi:hypothetical protein
MGDYAESQRIYLPNAVIFTEIQNLMGMFLYLPHGISSSPYSHLLDPNLWVEIYDVFTRDACSLLGLSVDSPLSVW